MLPDHRPFLDRLFALLPGRPTDYQHLPIDHLCYRVDSLNHYEQLRDELNISHILLTESRIGGRPISVFRMAEPFTYQGRRIDLLELPAPKPGRPYPAGWEHVEFVTGTSLRECASWLSESLGVSAADIDVSGADKPINADLRLRLADGLSVKFHELPLDEVIRLEQEAECNTP